LHPYSDDELLTQDIETLKIVEHSRMVDGNEVSKLFRKFKKKGILEQAIEMHMTEYKVYSVPQMEINDYIDQFIYYRKLRGYTQEQVGQVIGISGKQYYKYEKRMHQFKDQEKIKAIANFLEIEEELKMLPSNHQVDNQQLKNFLIENDITNTEFSKQIGISRRSIVDWFNKNVEISEDSWTKIKEFMRNLENKRIKEQVME
jgi:DNA-binding XRE family transcriptional regulator